MGDPDELLIVLVGASFLLPIAGGLLPRSLIGFYGVLLVALAMFANTLWLSHVAFGEGSNGLSRWEHNSTGSHAFYVVAVVFEFMLVAAAAAVRKRPLFVRLVAWCAALTPWFVWVGAFIAFSSE